MAGFLLWTNNLLRWRLYQPDLVHHFIDVCLEDLDYQLVERPGGIFWWMQRFLHNAYPWLELRSRIARRMLDIAGVAKEQKIVRTALDVLCRLEPVIQCIDRHFLAEFVRIMTSDEALFSPCFCKVLDMADLVLADDLARLVAFRTHLLRALLKPEMFSEVRHELLELLAGWPASGCAKRFRLGQDGGLRWGTSTQRSTAAWSSSSYLRNGALQGVQEENSREGSCNLGVLWLCVPPLNCILLLNSVGEGCSMTWFFSDALIPTRTGLRDVLTFKVVVSRPETQSSWTRSEFPQTACQRLAGKRKTDLLFKSIEKAFSPATVTVGLRNIQLEVSEKLPQG